MSPTIERDGSRLIDLSHEIHDGMVTYPGVPAPRIGTYLSREASEALYQPGVTFHIGMITICTNTGTYIDVPFHRFADGYDLAQLPLARVAMVPGVCLDRRGIAAIDIAPDELHGRAGHAVLIRTDHSRHFGRPEYGCDHPHLTGAAAVTLQEADVACVGIDSLNIDSTDDPARPVHSTLLRAEIPIIEHLTRLDQLPPTGFTFSAVPPKIGQAGTFTVRAYAILGPTPA